MIERLPFAPRGSQADETSSRDLQHSTRAVAHLTEQEEASPESNTSTPVCLASDVNSISTGDLTTVENPTSLGPLPRASWPANEREDSDGMIPFDDRPVTFGITPPTMDSSNTSPTPVVGNLLTGTVRASDEVDSSENSMPSRDNESSDAPASNAALPKPQSATLLQALSFVRPSRDLSDQRATSTAAESARQPTIDTLPALSQSEEPIASEFQATDLRATTVPDQAATP